MMMLALFVMCRWLYPPPPYRFARDGGIEARTEKYSSGNYTTTVLIMIGGVAERTLWRQ